MPVLMDDDDVDASSWPRPFNLEVLLEAADDGGISHNDEVVILFPKAR